MALVESGLKENGWPRRSGRGKGEQDWLREVFEAAEAGGWDVLSTKKESQHGRQTGPLVPDQPHVDDRDREYAMSDPLERYNREIAALRAELSTLRQAVSTPRKRRRRKGAAPTLSKLLVPGRKRRYRNES